MSDGGTGQEDLEAADHTSLLRPAFMADQTDIYVINGFYAAMRSKYTKAGEAVYYYAVQWNSSLLSWAGCCAH